MEPPCSCQRTTGLKCERFERWAFSSKSASIQKRGRYAELLDIAVRGSPHLPDGKERELVNDVERTCPTLSFFHAFGGRKKLTDILKSWVVYDSLESEDRIAGGSAVGYVQGMSFIATVLLWHAGDDEAAFWVFVAMMKHYDLRHNFEPPDMHGLKMRSYTMSNLLHLLMPQLSQHLAEHLQNNFESVILKWLCTLFAGCVPLDPLAILWDHFFEEGYIAIYRLILARLRCLEPWLRAETDFHVLDTIIKHAHITFDRSLGEPRPLAIDSTDLGTNAAAQWTCLACNGSEQCQSWEHLIVVLLQGEKIPTAKVMELEQVFGSRAAHGGEHADDSDRVAGVQHIHVNEADYDVAEIDESPEKLNVAKDDLREEKTPSEKVKLIKPLICEVYHMHNPSKLERVDDLLEKYKGREEQLYNGVCEKYGVDPKLPKAIGLPSKPEARDEEENSHSSNGATIPRHIRRYIDAVEAENTKLASENEELRNELRRTRRADEEGRAELGRVRRELRDVQSRLMEAQSEILSLKAQVPASKRIESSAVEKIDRLLRQRSGT